MIGERQRKLDSKKGKMTPQREEKTEYIWQMEKGGKVENRMAL